MNWFFNSNFSLWRCFEIPAAFSHLFECVLFKILLGGVIVRGNHMKSTTALQQITVKITDYKWQITDEIYVL